MLHDFLSNNTDELTRRCRMKVADRDGRNATEPQLQNGVPMFLGQLIETLRIEQTDDPMQSRRISGPSGGGAALSEVGVTAAKHGRALLALGFTVDQVVRDYGDLCQAITDLAFERDAPFSVDEFRTLNRCLDNAIAEAVTLGLGLSIAEECVVSNNGSLSVLDLPGRRCVCTINLPRHHGTWM